jgi:hypothetical protein
MLNCSNSDNSTRASSTLFWQNQLLDTKNETAQINLTGFRVVFEQFNFLRADKKLLNTQLLETQLLDTQLLDTSHAHVRQ